MRTGSLFVWDGRTKGWFVQCRYNANVSRLNARHFSALTATPVRRTLGVTVLFL